MDLWIAVLKRISEKLSKPSYETWFEGTTAEINSNEIIIKTGNQFSADWLETRYEKLICETVQEFAGQTYEIKFISDDQIYKKEEYMSQKFTEANPLKEMKSLIYEQGLQLKTQQEKIEKLERRIQILEQERQILIKDEGKNIGNLPDSSILVESQEDENVSEEFKLKVENLRKELEPPIKNDLYRLIQKLVKEEGNTDEQ